MKSYRLWSGDIVFVKQLEAGDFCVFSQTPDGKKQERICHRMLPISRTQDAAQRFLDSYAAQRGLEVVAN